MLEGLRGVLRAQRGLTNGRDARPRYGMGSDVGLINGMPSKSPGRAPMARAPCMSGRRKRRAARRALDHKARAPLPG